MKRINHIILNYRAGRYNRALARQLLSAYMSDDKVNKMLDILKP